MKKLKLAGKLPESNCRMRSCSFFSSSLTQNLNYFSSCCSSQNMVNWISPKLLIFSDSLTLIHARYKVKKPAVLSSGFSKCEIKLKLIPGRVKESGGYLQKNKRVRSLASSAPVTSVCLYPALH